MYLLLLTVSHVISQTCETDEFHCWSESERKTQTFINNNEKALDYLPTIRFVQGYWDCQTALQYIGYLYLKERMGLSVQFHPSIESGLTNDDLVSKYGYPYFWWEAIREDEYDIILESWPFNFAALNVQPPFDDGRVIYGGINHLNIEVAVFVPDYVYDELQEAILPKQLKHNAILRQRFIDAYTINSDKDWVKELNDTLYANTNLLERYLSKNFTLPSYDLPIIWGSDMNYLVINGYTRQLTKHYQLYNDTPGIDWIFCPLLSEDKLLEFVVDLYEHGRGEPFIISHFSPSSIFATVSKRIGELMQFQKVAFRWNADNSLQANCSKHYQCEQGGSPSYKMFNPRLYERIPEITAFVFDFKMLTHQANDIVSYKRSLDQTHWQMSQHQKWLNASYKLMVKEKY
eukprot:72804_1